MYADDLNQSNGIDQSIITGLGCNPNLIENDSIFDITAPQATSTAGNKKTRGDLARKYLNTLEEASENELGGFQPFKRAGGGDTITTSDVLNVHPQKADDGKLTASSSLEEHPIMRESSDIWRMMDVPLIRVESISDLSSSRFLVDHTTLSTGEFTRAQHDRGPLSSQEAKEPGFDDKYFEKSVEILRSHDQEQSYAHSTLLQAKGWHTSATASEIEGRVGGLPSALLQPQHSLLEMQHAKGLTSYSWENGEDSFVNSKVHFDVRQISANSTIFRGGLEESKLMSTSCNSLGSIGADVNDDIENYVHDEPREDANYDLFQGDQSLMASIFEGESFHNPNLDFFDEEEKETCKEYKFLEAEDHNAKHDYTCFSGIYGVTEITVRPSWISSNEKHLVGPGNKMQIDDYLESRSEALGSLENKMKGKRPSFGTAVHSPPMTGNPLKLIDVSVQDSSMSQFCLQPGVDEKQKRSPVINVKYDDVQISRISHADTNCASELDDDSPEETFLPESPKKRNLSGPSSVKLGYTKDINKVNDVKPSKDLMGSYLSETADFGSYCKPVLKVLEKPGQRKEDYVRKLPLTERSRNFEEILNNIEDSPSAEVISSLMSDALESQNPQELINKIILMTQAKSAVNNTLDETDLDMSKDVLELRRQREAIQSRPQAKTVQRAEGESLGKENIGKKITHKLGKNFDKKTLQPPPSDSTLKPSTGISHKPMDRLKASKTQSLKTNFSNNYTSENPIIDESIKMVQYKSRILEETQKLHLPSFHEGNSNGIDSSTPCVVWTKSRAQSSSLHSRPEGQTVIENYRLGTELRNPRESPESSASESARDMSTNVITGTTIRSTSFPTGLHSLGIAGGTSLELTPQSKRSYRSQDNVTRQIGEFNLPQRVVFPNVCVIGIASDVGISFHNPTQRWVQVSLKLVKETIDSRPTNVSALLYKPSYFMEPRSKCEITLRVCSQINGLLEAIFEVSVSDLTTGSGTYAVASQIFLHTIVISANINEPDIELTCDGEDVLDFGVVPEGCNVSHKVTLINHSPQALPVILHLQQVEVTSPIFFWDAPKNECAKTISSTRLSLELPAPCAKSGPVPQMMTVSLKAPHLDNIKVGEHGVVGVRSQMQVELDTPNNSTIIVTSFPLKAHIGAVRLQSLRTAQSYVLETMSNETCTASLVLKNSSTFALRISLKPREYEELFKVNPNNFVIQAHSQVAPALLFAPKGQAGRMQSVLLMRVEPEGIEFELPIVGISNALPPPSVILKKLSAAGAQESQTKSNCSPVSVRKSSSAPLLVKESSSAAMSVTESNGAAMSQLAVKDLGNVLESTKSRLVFGTASIGGSSSRKLVMRNSCTTQALSLTLGISGSKSYQVSEFGSNAGQRRMEVVLNPCQELALSVFMCPTEVAPLSGFLFCKYHGDTNKISTSKIPLQGYGGASELEIPDTCDGKPLIFKDLAPGVPAIRKTAFINKGERAMFLKLTFFTDDQCLEELPSKEILAQPSEFILAPKENRGVFVIASGTANILAKTPGCVGVLQVISGDEILRQRFRRLKNKEVKIRRINDPTLLKINWDKDYTRKEAVHNEDNCLRPQPEDSTIFYNSCSKIQIQLYGTSRERDEASTTVFACLNADDTMSSMADITVTDNRLVEVNQPTVDGPTSHPPPKSSNVMQATASQFSWDIFPRTISIVASDVSEHVFFVINLNNVQQMFEATSNCRWLDVEPREAILPCIGSVKVLVKIMPSRMPQPLVKPLTQTLKIMCENESRCASITVLPAVDGSCDAEPKAVATQHDPAHHGLPSRVPFPDQIKSIDLQATELRLPPVKYPSTSTASSERTAASSNVAITGGSQGSESVLQHMDNTESLVQVVSGIINFPDTPVMREYHMKMTLKNSDSVPHVVSADVIKGPFAVRHSQFRIKSEHYVSVPVYFRPKKTGVFSGQLMLVVLEEQKTIPVQLYGRAVL